MCGSWATAMCESAMDDTKETIPHRKRKRLITLMILHEKRCDIGFNLFEREAVILNLSATGRCRLSAGLDAGQLKHLPRAGSDICGYKKFIRKSRASPAYTACWIRKSIWRWDKFPP